MCELVHIYVCYRITPEEYGVVAQLAALALVVQDPVLRVGFAEGTGCALSLLQSLPYHRCCCYVFTTKSSQFM